MAALTASVSHWIIGVSCFSLSDAKWKQCTGHLFPSLYNLMQHKIIFGDLVFTWEGANVFVRLVCLRSQVHRARRQWRLLAWRRRSLRCRT